MKASKKRMRLVMASLLCISVLSGCVQSESAEPKEAPKQEDTGLKEDRRIYKNDTNEIVTLYMTISEKNVTEKNLSFFDLNHWYDLNNSVTDSPSLEVVFQEGDETGPKQEWIALTGNQPNASLTVRGRSNRVAAQKSYKIKLANSGGLWKGQKTINLNKHSFDMTRVRNKLSFDYFKTIPHMASFRTSFIHLYIKDETDGAKAADFEDYGLYTQIEQGNERFLAAHGLDPNGQLYKAENFEFFRYQEEIKLADDEKYQKKLFEQRLEIHGNEDHQKLIEMLDDVNNPKVNINDVIEQHFDQENYLTWMAVNILMGNHDITTQNYYLYSPLHSSKWYFLPWDYDGAWGWESQDISKTQNMPSWQEGIGVFWGVNLHKRFLKNPDNVRLLTKKVNELYTTINEKNTKEYLETYDDIVAPFIKRAPDNAGLPLPAGQYEQSFAALAKVPGKQRENYLLSLEKPMPFFLDEASISSGQVVLTWEHSYDLQEDDLSYTVEVSKDPAFAIVIRTGKDLRQTSYTMSSLPSGQYYWRVIAKDGKNNTQLAFDEYVHGDGNIFNGVKTFTVE